MTLACEHLARIGYRHLLGAPTEPRGDDAESVAEAKRRDHGRVFDALLSEVPKQFVGRAGALWLLPITWPDRVPGLVPWSGRQSLAAIIRARQLAVRWVDRHQARNLAGIDPLELRVPMHGASGIDADNGPTPLEIGFSIHTHGALVSSRPALELLAIVGLETVPLVSYAARECGIVDGDGRVYRFEVEPRGDYYHRWGEIHEERNSQREQRQRWAELDRLYAAGRAQEPT